MWIEARLKMEKNKWCIIKIRSGEVNTKKVT